MLDWGEKRDSDIRKEQRNREEELRQQEKKRKNKSEKEKEKKVKKEERKSKHGAGGKKMTKILAFLCPLSLTAPSNIFILLAFVVLCITITKYSIQS